MEKNTYQVYRIASLLADHGLDNKDLAELIGVSETTVTKWCKHKAQPTKENMFKIAEALKVNMKDLIVSSEWPDGPSKADNLKKKKKK